MDSDFKTILGMDKAVDSVLNEYHERANAESERIRQIPLEEFQNRWDEFLLSVGPAFGNVMNILVKEAGSRTILEIGTSYGYSTIWLAEAARHTGGKVISLIFIPKSKNTLAHPSPEPAWPTLSNFGQAMHAKPFPR